MCWDYPTDRESLFLNDTAIATRMQKKEVVRRMAQRMKADEKTAAAWLDACTETVYDTESG